MPRTKPVKRAEVVYDSADWVATSKKLDKIAKAPQIGIRASANMRKKPMISVPADGEANLRAGRPIAKKNMSVPNTTVRRLSDEISYSQPVLYAHFGSREGIFAAVAIEGFHEMGLALEKALKRIKRGNTVEAVAAASLEFAASSPALCEVMFPLSLSVPFDDAATPPEWYSVQQPDRILAVVARGYTEFVQQP